MVKEAECVYRTLYNSETPYTNGMPYNKGNCI